MRTKYPTYRKGDLERTYKKLRGEDKKLLNDFCKTISANKNKIDDMKRSILQFRDITNKPFKQIDKKDLAEFIPLLDKSGRKKYTINSIKTHIKRFLRYVHEDWYIRFENLKAIKCVSDARNEEKINSKNMINREQIEKIMAKEKDFVKKAFFITLFESAVRPIELRLLKFKDIHYTDDLTELQIFSTKTNKSRPAFVKNATFYLKKLEGKKEDLVFSSREGSNQPITKETALNWIKGMGKAVGLEVYPYLLRHSRATELHKLVNEGKMSSAIASKIMGHSEKTFMSYGDLDDTVIKTLMSEQLYNDELPEEKRHKLEKELDELKETQETLFNHIKNVEATLDKERKGKVVVSKAQEKKIIELIAVHGIGEGLKKATSTN